MSLLPQNKEEDDEEELEVNDIIPGKGKGLAILLYGMHPLTASSFFLYPGIAITVRPSALRLATTSRVRTERCDRGTEDVEDCSAPFHLELNAHYCVLSSRESGAVITFINPAELAHLQKHHHMLKEDGRQCTCRKEEGEGQRPGSATRRDPGELGGVHICQ